MTAAAGVQSLVGSGGPTSRGMPPEVLLPRPQGSGRNVQPHTRCPGVSRVSSLLSASIFSLPPLIPCVWTCVLGPESCSAS